MAAKEPSDGWYFIIRGTNERWERHIREHAPSWSSGWYLDHNNRYGGSGGLSTVGTCLTNVQCAAFRIAAATGMTIHDNIEYDKLLQSNMTSQPRMIVVLHIPGDETGSGDIIIEGLCNYFSPRRMVKKALMAADKEKLLKVRGVGGG